MALPSIPELADAGFERSDRGDSQPASETALRRGPNEDGIAHVLLFSRMEKRWRGYVQVSACVYHEPTERVLAAVFRDLGLETHARGIERVGGGYALGVTLGSVAASELSWTSPLSWFDGSHLSLEAAVERLDTFATLVDVHRALGTRGGHRQTWASADHYSALRCLIVQELLFRQGRASREEQAETYTQERLARSFLTGPIPFARIEDTIQGAIDRT